MILNTKAYLYLFKLNHFIAFKQNDILDIFIIAFHIMMDEIPSLNIVVKIMAWYKKWYCHVQWSTLTHTWTHAFMHATALSN